MKIAFFTDALIPPLGGIEQHVLDTSRALAKQGHEVRVYYPDPGSGHDNHAPQSPTLLNLAFRPVPGLPMTFLWPNFRFSFPLHFYGQIKSWHPNVLHLHTSGPMAWTAIILAKMLKRFATTSLYSNVVKHSQKSPLLVGTFHSYLMEKEYLANQGVPGFLMGLVSKLVWKYVSFVFNRCDVVVSPSQWVAGDIKAHGINKPVVVVHNGADLSQFGERAREQVVSDLVTKYNLRGNTLLYVGRLSQEKGLDVLFRALKTVNEKLEGRSEKFDEEVRSGKIENNQLGPTSNLNIPLHTSSFPRQIFRCQLLLVGNGPMEEELEKLASDLGISEQVIFVGRVNHPDLPGSGIFEVAKAFVTASTSENQPLTIIEAMAKGLPIIGVSARGVTELVRENGLLAVPDDPVDLANKIQQVLADEDARLKMGDESRKISQDYSLTKAAERLEKLYQISNYSN